MPKKIIVILIVVAILTTGFSLFALAMNTANQNSSGKPDVNLGKNIALTEEQMKIKQEIVEKFDLQEKAKKFGVDPKGLTDEELKQIVIEKEKDDLIVKAKKFGIDTKGLTKNSGLNENAYYCSRCKDIILNT